MLHAPSQPHPTRANTTPATQPQRAPQVTVGTIGVAAAVVSGTLSLTTLPSLGIQLSNTFGLVCVLALLGYGLVAVPRRAWRRSFPELQLRHQLFRCVPVAACNVQCKALPPALAVSAFAHLRRWALPLQRCRCWHSQRSFSLVALNTRMCRNALALVHSPACARAEDHAQ